MRTDFVKTAIIKSNYADDVYTVTDTTEEKVELASVTFDPDDETYHINGEEYITVPAKTVDKFFTVIRPAEPEVPDIQDYTVKDGVLYYTDRHRIRKGEGRQRRLQGTPAAYRLSPQDRGHGTAGGLQPGERDH